MLYLANPSSPDIVAAMNAGHLGLMEQPYPQGHRGSVRRLLADGVPWAADNGCFADKWSQYDWWSFLHRRQLQAATCLFAVAPDVVADAEGTYHRSLPWLPRIRDLGYPVAYVAQDGAECRYHPPWQDLDVLFIGGSTAWKLGLDARLLVAEARARAETNPCRAGQLGQAIPVRPRHRRGHHRRHLPHLRPPHQPPQTPQLDHPRPPLGDPMSSWRPETMTYPCPYCHAPPGHPCTTNTGRKADLPHATRTQPKPRCKKCDTLLPYGNDGPYCTRCLLVRQLEIERVTKHQRRNP